MPTPQASPVTSPKPRAPPTTPPRLSRPHCPPAGDVAGQEVPHVHIHVVARFGGDELDELAARIATGLG
ncbi:HIT domain-containing protein [Flindersiella endophytica]